MSLCWIEVLFNSTLNPHPELIYTLMGNATSLPGPVYKIGDRQQVERANKMPETQKISVKEIILEHLSSIAVIFGALTTGLALLSYAILGFYSRYYADDYCMSGLVFQRGFWQAQIDQYMGWSNRFSGMFTLSLSEFFGNSAIKVWTALVLVLLVAAFAWTLAQLNRWLKLSLSRWILVLLSEWVVFFTILFAPQLYQSFFWRIGIITYTLPLIFLVLLAGLVIRLSTQAQTDRAHRGGLVACAVLAFFAGGLSETYLVLQLSITLLGLVAVLLLVKDTSRRRWLLAISAVLIGSLLSLAVVLASPGNAVRQAAMPPPPGLLAWIKMILLHAFLFMYRLLDANPFQFLLAVLIPSLLVYGYYANKSTSRLRPSLLFMTLLLAPVVGFVLVAAVMAPAAYVQSSYPDDRVLVEAGFLMAVMLVFFGALVGMIFRQLHLWAEEAIPFYLQIMVALFAVVLLLYPLYDARKNIALFPKFQARAASWDSRDARIRAARQSGEFVNAVKGFNAPGNLAEFQVDPGDWVNQCASSFYDVSQIKVGGQ
jgi:hypothetical protein